MTTMYIACNHCTAYECFLGDVITMIKAAHLFVENEPHDNVVMSLYRHEPLNFLWDKFIDTHRVRIVWDDLPKKATRISRSRRRGNLYYPRDMHFHYRLLHERVKTRTVKNLAFDTYKELYPWRLWAQRQSYLCGSPCFSPEMNIFEGYYYGQQEYADQPKNIKRFLPGLIKYRRDEPAHNRAVFIAPHEKCQRNRIFTLAFWEAVVGLLLKEDVLVILNSKEFLQNLHHPRLRAVFLPVPKLIAQIASQRLVVCGNTGVGWVAAAVGTRFIAMEKDMINEEYCFQRCGCHSLVDTVREPDPQYTVKAVLQHLQTF